MTLAQKMWVRLRHLARPTLNTVSVLKVLINQLNLNPARLIGLWSIEPHRVKQDQCEYSCQQQASKHVKGIDAAVHPFC